MRRGSTAIAKIFPFPVRSIRSSFVGIASKVLSEAQEATGAVCNTLEQQYKFASKKLSKTGRKATRLTRRYPIQTIAIALACGFLIGRSRR